MNLFYILLYNYLYNDTTELFDYLQTPFSLTEANPFSSLFSKHMINCESLSHTMLQIHLNKYMKWYESMRSNELRIDIVKIHNMKMKLMFEYGGNLFFSRQTKDTIFKIYQNIQKHYLVLIRFFAICARRRIRKNPTVSTDLYLTDLIMENKNTFLLYQNKSLYMFSLNDLMHLFESALCYRYESDFQVLPVIPKNPYNNILFERDDLYNIYFFMRFSTCKIIPLFFHLWFLEDFQFRVTSPLVFLFSILITLAPSSEKNIPTAGPASTLASSTTFKSLKTLIMLNYKLMVFSYNLFAYLASK